ncbi:autophagy protein apg6 domain-containing protein [Ditylenchus destructor]|nr:autophagy protein apg6 domain-containing protein [Ditylenchus destructor]
MEPLAQSLPHCLLCQCKLDLHPTLSELRIDDTKSEDSALSDIKSQLHDNSGLLDISLFESGGNLLELICKSNSPLQMPMCKKCSVTISADLSRQLSDLENECVSYKAALDNLVTKKAESGFDSDIAKRRLETLQAEENELIEQLAALENEEKSLAQELDNKLEERKSVTESDAQLYKRLRDNHRILIEQSEEQRSLKAQLKFVNEQVQRLIRTNVLDMTFFIWKDGEYGTINGFRLGRLRHELVDWHEINAAFGQVAFLLLVIAEKMGMKFTDYEIFPCGSYSFIRAHRPDGKTEDLPLYGSGGWRPFGQPALDQAIVAYCECFSQVEARLKAKFPSATQILPYRMLKDKIIDKDSQYLVKMQLNSEERWTKAMKCLLLNLKRVVGILANTRPIQTAQQQNNGNSATST